jgi:hypothetical protein
MSYYEPALGFQLLNPLHSEDELDNVLRKVETYLGYMRRYAHYSFRSKKMKYYMEYLMRFKDPLDYQISELESKCEELQSLENHLAEKERQENEALCCVLQRDSQTNKRAKEVYRVQASVAAEPHQLCI